MRFALCLEYHGSAYAGWQAQPHAPSVQSTLESALSQIADEPIAVVCAGRTDTGVHALGQVVHFDTRAVRPIFNWVRGLNALLPSDVAVRAMTPVDEAFHARFDASFRHYQYLILNQATRSTLWHQRVNFVVEPLDHHRMHEAAQTLVGYHDFNAFRSSQCQSHSSHRHVLQLSVQRQGPFVVLNITANAFLHHMVRNIVGSLLWIGQGKTSAPWLAEVLASRDRTQAGPTAEAAGLYFMHVGYPQTKAPDFGISPISAIISV
jgi:tRNA pseudouridine38-40 synthase